ncbi:MAG TPA: hypothetical protein PK916_09120 [Bacteroidota bacterium]|nr:hypothetical protein [Bacteroidota bacterium]
MNSEVNTTQDTASLLNASGDTPVSPTPAEPGRSAPISTVGSPYYCLSEGTLQQLRFMVLRELAAGSDYAFLTLVEIDTLPRLGSLFEPLLAELAATKQELANVTEERNSIHRVKEIAEEHNAFLSAQNEALRAKIGILEGGARILEGGAQ